MRFLKIITASLITLSSFSSFAYTANAETKMISVAYIPTFGSEIKKPSLGAADASIYFGKGFNEDEKADELDNELAAFRIAVAYLEGSESEFKGVKFTPSTSEVFYDRKQAISAFELKLASKSALSTDALFESQKEYELASILENKKYMVSIPNTLDGMYGAASLQQATIETTTVKDGWGFMRPVKADGWGFSEKLNAKNVMLKTKF